MTSNVILTHRLPILCLYTQCYLQTIVTWVCWHRHLCFYSPFHTYPCGIQLSYSKVTRLSLVHSSCECFVRSEFHCVKKGKGEVAQGFTITPTLGYGWILVHVMPICRGRPMADRG